MVSKRDKRATQEHAYQVTSPPSSRQVAANWLKQGSHLWSSVVRGLTKSTAAEEEAYQDSSRLRARCRSRESARAQGAQQVPVPGLVPAVGIAGPSQNARTCSAASRICVGSSAMVAMARGSACVPGSGKLPGPLEAQAGVTSGIVQNEEELIPSKI